MTPTLRYLLLITDDHDVYRLPVDTDPATLDRHTHHPLDSTVLGIADDGQVYEWVGKSNLLDPMDISVGWARVEMVDADMVGES